MGSTGVFAVSLLNMLIALLFASFETAHACVVSLCGSRATSFCFICCWLHLLQDTGAGLHASTHDHGLTSIGQLSLLVSLQFQGFVSVLDLFVSSSSNHLLPSSRQALKDLSAKASPRQSTNTNLNTSMSTNMKAF